MSVESLRIHPAALEEAEAATDWYAQRSRRAAERFLDELDRAVDQIARNPAHYPLYDFGTRRMVLQRFPFVIVFREVPAGVESSHSLTGVAGRDTGATGWDKVRAFSGFDPER